jgi:serine phosphatase RsbU (regulator of sigma subunit)
MSAREVKPGSSSIVRSCRETLEELRREGAPVALVERLSGLVSLVEDELRNARRAGAVNAYALHSLFDASQDLTGTHAEDSVGELILTSVMGHFLVSRGALYAFGPHGLSLAWSRGLARASESAPVPAADAQAALERAFGPTAVTDLPDGRLRRRLEKDRLTLAIPLAAGGAVDGILAIGGRASGIPFSAEDREVAATLARQAGTALENARLQRISEEKKRQDRELQIAREIQESLLPKHPPELSGFDVAGRSRPCYEVGGDSYDWIPLAGERLALVVADVSGKGTPASLLMASVHAFVHAIAGMATPAQVIERLNRFLLARTQASRFVTLFYAELDAATHRLAYVNAGHVPPYRVARDGTVSRLREGGPATGLLPEASYEVGELTLEPGELVAMVTDGVTEAMAPDDREFGDDGVCATLRAMAGAKAPDVLRGLVTAASEWTGGAGVGDDLTALILQATRAPS